MPTISIAGFFDDGRDLEDVVPVLGIVVDAVDDEKARLVGPWTGECSELGVGGVRFDFAEVARLATPDKPGRWDISDEGFLVLQP